MAKKSGLHPGAVYALFKELRLAAAKEGPLVVEGPPALAEALRRELGRGGSPGAIRGGDAEGALCLVHVLAAGPTPEDEARLKRAHRLRVPVVAVLAGPGLDPRVPYVLATDVVRVDAGAGFPVDRIARAVAARAGEQGPWLAARIPLLRDAVCDELVETYSRRHALVGAAVFIPGADFPVIALGQVRMVLRIAAAHGVEVDNERLPEILGVIGSGFVMRGLARRLLGAVPGLGIPIRAATAYAGTRALGEAAIRYFAARAPGSVRGRT
jgi:uncharacterized protein (DUF697 family)